MDVVIPEMNSYYLVRWYLFKTEGPSYLTLPRNDSYRKRNIQAFNLEGMELKQQLPF